MTNLNSSLAARLASATKTQQQENNTAEFNAKTIANNAVSAEASANPVATRVFYGEFPPAISYLTPSGKPVFFYQGHHVTEDSEVIAFCATIAGVSDVTDQVELARVPRPELRTRQRNWASAERTTITPGELLSRAARVQSTADLPQAASSNSTV